MATRSKRNMAIIALALLVLGATFFLYPLSYELGIWMGNEHLYAFGTFLGGYNGKHMMSDSLPVLLFAINIVIIFHVLLVCTYRALNKRNFATVFASFILISFPLSFLFGVANSTYPAGDALGGNAFYQIFSLVMGSGVAFALIGLLSWLIACAFSCEKEEKMTEHPPISG